MLAVIAFQGWMVYDWRALALSRSSVETAAEKMCGEMRGLAQAQAETLEGFALQTHSAINELAACRAEQVQARVTEP